MRKRILLQALAGFMAGSVCHIAYGSTGYGFFGRPTDTIDVNGDTIGIVQMTIEARFQIPTALAGGGGDIFHEQLNAQEDKFLNVGFGGITAGAWTGFANGADDPGITAPVAVAPGLWHHIAFVRDGDFQRLYLDGTLIDTRDVRNTPYDAPIRNASGSAMALGALQFAGQAAGVRSNSFEGLLDWVRVSDSSRYTGQSFTAPVAEPTADPTTELLFDFNASPGASTITDHSGGASTGHFGAGFMGATYPRVVVPGDANLDGSVNFSDLVVLAANYGSKTGQWTTGDFNGDGTVDFRDLVALAANYGSPFGADPQSAQVPEPAVVAALGGLSILLWRRRILPAPVCTPADCAGILPHDETCIPAGNEHPPVRGPEYLRAGR